MSATSSLGDSWPPLEAVLVPILKGELAMVCAVCMAHNTCRWERVPVDRPSFVYSCPTCDTKYAVLLIAGRVINASA